MTSEELQKLMIEGIESCLSSERYKDYLRVMSKFHSYSFSNCICIAFQKPEATLVAGYRAWETKFNRHVKQGEKAIHIFAPLRKRKSNSDEDEEIDYIITGFKPVAVFDISQTEGDPLPSLANELSTSVSGFEEVLSKLIIIAKVPVTFSSEPFKGYGYFSASSNKIVVRRDIAELQKIKTLLHEIAHSRLHGLNADEKVSREVAEVEAESVAFIVCNYLGLDTSSYSFGYITSWSGGDTDLLKTSFKRIHKVATELIKEYKG